MKKYKIDKSKYAGCGACARICSHGAIKIKDEKAIIDQNKCQQCGICAETCPFDAIKK